MRALISCGVYCLPSISSVFHVVPMCALDAADGAVDVGDRLVLGRLADEDLAVLGERDDRGRGARALGVRDDRRLAALQDGDDGVGGAEVDTDRSSHGDWPLFRVCWGWCWSAGKPSALDGVTHLARGPLNFPAQPNGSPPRSCSRGPSFAATSHPRAGLRRVPGCVAIPRCSAVAAATTRNRPWTRLAFHSVRDAPEATHAPPDSPVRPLLRAAAERRLGIVHRRRRATRRLRTRRRSATCAPRGVAPAPARHLHRRRRSRSGRPGRTALPARVPGGPAWPSDRPSAAISHRSAARPWGLPRRDGVGTTSA